MTHTVDNASSSIRSYSRLAGILLALTIVAGGFGEFWAPTHLIVSGDAAATAANIIAHPSLLRWGFAAYLVEAVCDITLAWIFYVMLKPVNRNLALLTAFFGLVSTATFAGVEVFYFAPSFILGGGAYLKSFTPDQLNSLAMLSLKLYGVGAGILMAFYGIGWIVRGYLMYKSTYMPKSLGALAAIAGFGFVAHNLALVLTPAYASDLMLAPMFLLDLALVGWLLVKGVDESRYAAMARGTPVQ